MLLRWWKQHGSNGLIGLDIGSNVIKLLEIKSTEKPFRVESFAIVPLPTGTIVKGEIKDPNAIGAALKELFKRKNIQTKSVALAISRSSAIIKNIQVDNRLTPSEIESRAWIEANHHFPDLVGEIYLDFSVSPSTENPSQLDLVLVACRKDQIKPYLDALQQSGLVAKIIDVNSYALERALALMAESFSDLNTVALLNLDLNVSTLLVVHDRKLIFAHDHAYDGQRLQTSTQEYLKTAVGQIASLNDAAYLEILKNALSAHLRHTMHFFYSSRPNINIQKLMLSGDCANTPALAEFIQQEVGIETVLANPFLGMTIASGVDAKELQMHAADMMLSCGLALSVDKPSNTI